MMGQDPVLIAYIAFIAMYFMMENIVMNRLGAKLHVSRKDKTLLYILIPFYFVIIAALLEYVYLPHPTSIVFWVCGAVFFVAGTLLRVKAHIDLGKGYSYSFKHPSEHKTIRVGLYRTIRHPLYLANLMIMIAAPLFMADIYTWLLTLAGIAGIHIRINTEESYLLQEVKDYAEYMRKTWKLIPKIY